MSRRHSLVGLGQIALRKSTEVTSLVPLADVKEDSVAFVRQGSLMEAATARTAAVTAKPGLHLPPGLKVMSLVGLYIYHQPTPLSMQ